MTTMHNIQSSRHVEHACYLVLFTFSLLFLTSLTVPALAAPAAADCLVCLGDSITDGYTYGQILIQALREAGKPVPTIICSGRSSDTAPQMAARLDQTVLVFQPQWVTFSAGTNDAVRGVTNEQFENALREIVAKVQARGGKLVLLTPSLILSRNGKTPQEQEARRKQYEARLDCFEAIIRKVAAEKHCLLAENHASLLAAIRSGEDDYDGRRRSSELPWPGDHGPRYSRRLGLRRRGPAADSSSRVCSPAWSAIGRCVCAAGRKGPSRPPDRPNGREACARRHVEDLRPARSAARRSGIGGGVDGTFAATALP